MYQNISKEIMAVVNTLVGCMDNRFLKKIRNQKDNWFESEINFKTIGLEAPIKYPSTRDIGPVDKGNYVIDPFVTYDDESAATKAFIKLKVYDKRLDDVFVWSYEENIGGNIPLANYKSGIEALNDLLKDIHSVDIDYGFCKKEA